MRSPCLAAVLAIALLAPACATRDEAAAPNRAAVLVLDAPPGAVHAGIYTAAQHDYAGALGVDLRLRVPTDPAEPAALLADGRAQFAVLDLHDLALARQRGRDLVGVMAIVQRPLAAVLARPSMRTPRDLERRRVGVSGRPGDRGVLRAIVARAGGDPARVRPVPVGFDAVGSLLGGRVAGVTGSWSAEGVVLRARRPGTREFRVDDAGAPPYPELVLAVTRATLQDAPALVRATVAALARGYREVLADPESGVSDLLAGTRGLRRADVQRELDAVSPAFTEGARAYGELDSGRLAAWARWEQRAAIVRRAPEV
ncbi:MAG: ABC transporter substrate-binding protein, partial [Actinobacteria bacterium]|nr:ABC transporter substrate-binding protein [Actinomycetota bacterium]